jgi:DNA-binding transcriptional ArsR family regulator
MLRPTNAVAPKARLFRALGDEPRLAVLEQLVAGEQRVSDLAAALGTAQSSISTHLATLHAAGVVARRSAGHNVYYAVAHPSVNTLLRSADEVVVASLQEAYTCMQPCCAGPTDALQGDAPA